MTQQRTPTGLNRQGQNEKNGLSGEKDSTVFLPAVQCLCAPCVYFRAVPLPSGYIRKLCSFTGERLTLSGNQMCEALQDRDGAVC